MALGDAVTAIEQAGREMGLPVTIHGKFAGTAQAYRDSTSNMPILILAALLTVYIVLGILYESLIHPITILSTLPSAGVGALLALMIFHTPLSVIAFIGIILLLGIVIVVGLISRHLLPVCTASVLLLYRHPSRLRLVSRRRMGEVGALLHEALHPS